MPYYSLHSTSFLRNPSTSEVEHNLLGSIACSALSRKLTLLDIMEPFTTTGGVSLGGCVPSGSSSTGHVTTGHVINDAVISRDQKYIHSANIDVSRIKICESERYLQCL